MNIQIEFNDLEKANEFVGILKEENLRGVKVKQAQKKPEEGSLDLAEYLPLITIVVQSGFAATAVSSVFCLLKGVLVENKKTKTEAEIERERIESAERMERMKLKVQTFIENKKFRQQSDHVEFTFEEKDKKVNFKFFKGDEEEQAQLLKIVSEIKCLE